MSNVDTVQESTDSKAKNQTVALSEPESALLQRLREGDEQSYETLIRSYGPRVLAIARHYLRSQADVDDV